MLKYLKDKLEKKYNNYILKVDPFILNSAGYNSGESILKIHTHSLYCTIVTISLTGCELLLFLDKKEYDLFHNFQNNLISVRYSFSDIYFPKPVSFFIRGTLKELNEIRENVYMINMSYQSINESYKEIFFHMSEFATKYREIYDSTLTVNQESCITERTFYAVAVYLNGSLMGDGFTKEISPRNIVVELRNKKQEIPEETQLEIDTLFYNKKIRLSGTFTTEENNCMEFALNYKTDFVYILSRFLIKNDDIQEI